MSDEMVNSKNFPLVRSGELNLFRKLHKTADPDEIIKATEDLKQWQLLYFGYTNLNQPITSAVVLTALGITIKDAGIVT